MLISKEVKVKWNGFTRKYYEKKGYKWTKQNDLFICKIEDLQPTSTVKVEVECDYCGKTHPKEYRNWIKGREIINKDCCSNISCFQQKSKEICLIKYGVENHMQTKESQEHLRQMWKTPFEEVIKLCEEKGLILLSKAEDYQNDRSRLKIICTYHENEGIQDTNFANIKANKGCCGYGKYELAAESTRLNGNKVYNDFIKQGLIPIFKPSDYVNTSIPLPYKCPKHIDKGVQYRNYSNLFYANGCEECANESRKEKHMLNEKDVFDYFKSRGLVIVENESYKGKDIHVKFKCPKHMDNTQNITYNGLKRTKCPCKFCREENNLNHLSRTIRSSLSWWRKFSKKICKNKCILTGEKSNFEIHHQYQLDNIIKDSLKELNIELKSKYSAEEIVAIKEKVSEIHKKLNTGVCIHKDIHVLFHVVYGKKDCDREMFIEFIKNYFNGNYDSRLEDKLKSINSKSNLEEASKIASLFYVQN